MGETEDSSDGHWEESGSRIGLNRDWGSLGDMDLRVRADTCAKSPC